MSVEIAAFAAYSPGMSEAGDLYERDFYAWTQSQAALLRAWPKALWPNALDIANLAEEIEDSGKSQRRAARSLLLRILEHLVKLQVHPDRSAERHWKKEVNSFRTQIEDVFAENPSLRAARAELAADLWVRAAELARRDMEVDGVDAGPGLARLQAVETPYFDLDSEVLAEGWFPPAPAC